MINTINLNKINEYVLAGKTLTTKALNEMGFVSNDLTKLVKDGTLIRIKHGIYELSHIPSIEEHPAKQDNFVINFNIHAKNISQKETNYNNNELITAICFDMTRKHIQKLKESIFTYLKAIKKECYFQFILNITKLYLNKKERYLFENYSEYFAFNAFIELLSFINNPKYLPNIDLYAQAATKAIAVDDLIAADIYLKIIDSLEDIGLIYSDYDQLRLKFQEKANAKMAIKNSEVTEKKILPDSQPTYETLEYNFTFNDTSYYKLVNFDLINDYINKTNLNVQTVCEEFNLTEEETDIVILIYARELLIQNNEAKANIFLRAFEKSKYKTARTLAIYNMLQKGRSVLSNISNSSPYVVKGYKLKVTRKKS